VKRFGPLNLGSAAEIIMVVSLWMNSIGGSPVRGGGAGSRAAAPWLNSPTMAAWQLRWAFLSAVFTYVGGEARGTHPGGPWKAATTENRHAIAVSFAQASAQA
jgi:hypothetical protein